MFIFAYIEVTQDITTGVIPLEAVRIPYRKSLTVKTCSVKNSQNSLKRAHPWEILDPPQSMDAS